MGSKMSFGRKSTIKSKVLKVSAVILLTYAFGLMFIIGKLFPVRFMEIQKQLNMDILISANQCLSEELENIYREYEGLLEDDKVIEALKECKEYMTFRADDKSQSQVRYMNAKNFLAERRGEVLFLEAKSISDLIYIVDNAEISILTSENPEFHKNDSLIEFLAGVEEEKILFFSMAQIPEYDGEREEFVICFPVYDEDNTLLGRICFILNREKEYVVWGDDELILLDGDNRIMFHSGNIQGITADDFLNDGEQFEKEIDGKKYLVARRELNLHDWKIVHILSVDRMQKTINEVMIFAIGAVMLVLFFAFLLMGNMSRLVSYNIEKITEEMDSFLGRGRHHIFYGKREKRWNDLANRLTLHQKFWIYYGTVIILPMILISMVVYSKCQYVIRTEYEKSVQILSDYSYQIIENKLYDDAYTLKTILVDTPLLENMYRYAQSRDEKEKKQLYYDIGMRIQNIGGDCEISYYDTDGEFVFSWPNMEAQRKRELNVNIDYNEKTIWDEYSRKFNFYMVRKVYIKSSEYVGDIGFLTMQIQEDAVYGILKNMNSDIEYCFADKENLIFASSSTEELGTRLEQEWFHEKGVKHYEDMSNYGISACIVISEDEMYELKNYLLWMLILLTLGCTVAAIMEERKNSTDMLESIAAVNQALLTGEDIDLSVQKGDELDALILSVDKMKERINGLIDELYEREIITRELELKVFQAQITPHFLCNTLEQINALIDMEDDRAGTLVLLLGKFFRQGISQDKQLITLAEEVEYTKVYTQIHKIVLGERLDISWKIPEELLVYKTVHFLLQPIIENSLKHGQFMKSDNRKITVKGYERKDSIVIGVSDNGAGISSERLRELRESLISKKMGGKSKGLKNVHERLRLTFGEQYGIRIYSREGKGVCIFLKLPKEV